MPISLLEDETLKFWDRYIVGAKVKIDGQEIDYPISEKRIEGHVLKFFVLLQSETGHVTNIKIVDSHGREVRVRDMNINKSEEGLMAVFALGIKVEEVFG